MVFREFSARLGRVNRYNLETLRNAPTAEISGALGDLGTLLPLMIALAIRGSIDLPSTLVLSGLFNVATGVIFGIPLPVQPMKAIAAAALTRGSSLGETTAAGGWVGAAVLFLSITGLIRWLTRNIPVPVVKGIQLGAGLRLVISAGSSLVLPLGWLSPLLDNRTWALIAFLVLLVITPTSTQHSSSSLSPRNKTPPFALMVFLLGICFSLLTIMLLEPRGDFFSHADTNHNPSPPHSPHLPFFAIWRPSLNIPTFLSPSSIGMALSQLPLTTLNSIIAASALAEDLFPPLSDPSPDHHSESLYQQFPSPSPYTPDTTPYPSPPTTTSLGISVALMNIPACFLGCMPLCHGSGGLAAQHRFGARSGSSVVLLGIFKTILGLFLGASLLDLLDAFPRAILGVMVAAAGLELARAASSLNHDAADLSYVVVVGWDEDGDDAGAGIGSGEGGRGSSSRRHGQVEDSSGDNNNNNNNNNNKQRQKRHRDLSDEERDERWAVMLMTTGGILAFRNDTVGFMAGMLCYWAYRLAEAWAGIIGGVDVEGQEDDWLRRAASGRRRRGYGGYVPRRKHVSRRRQRGGAGQTEGSPLLDSE